MDAPSDPQTSIALIKWVAAAWAIGLVALNFLARVWFKDHEKIGEAVTKEELKAVEITIRREMRLQMNALRAELRLPYRDDVH